MKLTEFGERLERIQKEKYISDSVLASRLGIRQPNITTIKHYTARPRLATIKKYAKALGVDFEDLYPRSIEVGVAKVWVTVETKSATRKIRVL